MNIPLLRKEICFRHLEETDFEQLRRTSSFWKNAVDTHEEQICLYLLEQKYGFKVYKNNHAVSIQKGCKCWSFRRERVRYFLLNVNEMESLNDLSLNDQTLNDISLF